MHYKIAMNLSRMKARSAPMAAVGRPLGSLSCSGGPAAPPPGTDSASIGSRPWPAVSFNLVVSEAPRRIFANEG